jgi:dTDP-4-dehydrorhamnose 3,5-epimerase
MKTTPSESINGLLVIQPEVFYDYRGENFETFNQDEFDTITEKNGLNKLKFEIDSYSFSKKDVLRGFHGDGDTWKLVQCLQGFIQLVVLDVRQNSPTHENYETFYLNEKNRTQVLIPAGCVNAHLCLSDTCIFGYKLSGRYHGIGEQLHVPWNDMRFRVLWPVDKPILSQRDAS